MRVFIDLTRMLRRSRLSAATGIDRWDLEVANWLFNTASALEPIAVVQSGGKLRRLPDAAGLVATLRRRWNRGGPPPAWPRLQTLAARLAPEIKGPGIYLNLSHQGLETTALWRSIKSSRLKSVIYLHDLIPITHPHTCRPEQASRHAARLCHSLSNADTILCPSQTVAADIDIWAAQRRIPVPPCQVLSPGVHHEAPPASALHQAPYAVILATLEPRKGHADLPGIWRHWTDPADCPRLLVIGQTGWRGAEILQSLRSAPELADRLTVRTDASDHQVITALQNATALLMPSCAEGWGMPVAEALRLNTPALCRDLPVYTETGQGHATLLPPPDTPDGAKAWQSELAALLETPRRISGYVPLRWPDQLAHLNEILRKTAG